MRSSSRLLTQLTSAVGHFDPNVDVQLDVPAVVVPIVRVPAPLPRAAGFSTTVINRSSFRQALTLTVPPSTGSVSTVAATLGRGLWRIQWSLALNSDYTTLGEVAAIRIIDPGLNVAAFGALMSRAGAQSVNGDVEFLIGEDSFQIDIANPATGVAQNAVIVATILANLLL